MMVLALKCLQPLLRMVSISQRITQTIKSSRQHRIRRMKAPRGIYVHAVINVNINSSYCISNVQLLSNNPNPASSLHAGFVGMEFYWEHNLFRHCHTHKNVFTTVQEVRVRHSILYIFQKHLRGIHWVAPRDFSGSWAAYSPWKLTVNVAVLTSMTQKRKSWSSKGMQQIYVK